MIATAYFRVYLPADDLSSFPEHLDGSARVLHASDISVWDESLVEDAYTTEWQSRPFVCPRYPRLRMLEGLLAFRNAYPGMIGSTLVPEQVVSRAGAELESLYEGNPSARSYILTSPWHVPLRWFVAFSPEQRELVEDNQQLSIRYRNTRRDATSRLTRAIRVLKRAGFDESVVEPVHGLRDWIHDFPEEALVELDYGSVSRLFTDNDLVLDESATHINASIEALDGEDLEQAGEHYALAASRWASMQARLYAN